MMKLDVRLGMRIWARPLSGPSAGTLVEVEVTEMLDDPMRLVEDTVIAAVREDLLRRSEFGIKKYGVTLNKSPEDLRGWLNHAYEEALDHANYLKCAMLKMDGKI